VIDRSTPGDLTAGLVQAGASSFADFAARVAPNVLPSSRAAGPGVADLAPHGTTIVAATFPGGVVVAGDRRATMGNVIAQRDIEKVFAADEFSIIGIAGAAGIAVELVGPVPGRVGTLREDRRRAAFLVGKANRLATMIRMNLGLAMQGLVVVPLFAGWDVTTEEGRIFSYDATGGRYEEHAFFSVGSGAVFARAR
jgi:proteasome beta subunit